jgi:hypothetical protein
MGESGCPLQTPTIWKTEAQAASSNFLILHCEEVPLLSRCMLHGCKDQLLEEVLRDGLGNVIMQRMHLRSICVCSSVPARPHCTWETERGTSCWRLTWHQHCSQACDRKLPIRSLEVLWTQGMHAVPEVKLRNDEEVVPPSLAWGYMRATISGCKQLS